MTKRAHANAARSGLIRACGWELCMAARKPCPQFEEAARFGQPPQTVDKVYISLAEFAPAGANQVEFIMGRNSFLSHNTTHGAHCASEASAGSGVHSVQIGASEAGPI